MRGRRQRWLWAGVDFVTTGGKLRFAALDNCVNQLAEAGIRGRNHLTAPLR